MEDYVILESISDSSVELEKCKSIIKKYTLNPQVYADPIMCKQEHLIGKVYIPEDDVTLFWVELLNVPYFLDVQTGKQ